MMADCRLTLLDVPQGKLEVEWHANQPFMHLELYEWSPSLYRQYKEVFKGVLDKLRAIGATRAFVIIPTGNKKLLKFEKMFGFDVHVEMNGHYVMSQEL